MKNSKLDFSDVQYKSLEEIIRLNKNEINALTCTCKNKKRVDTCPSFVLITHSLKTTGRGSINLKLVYKKEYAFIRANMPEKPVRYLL